MNNGVWIPGNVPSAKRQRYHDKYTRAYLKAHGIQNYNNNKKTLQGYVRRPITFPFDELKKEFKGAEKILPIKAGIHFVRKYHHVADHHNLQHIIIDLMVIGGVIPDDDLKHFYAFPMPINGQFVSYDKHNPGVWVKRIDSIDIV